MRYRTLSILFLTTLVVSGVSHASYNCQEKQYHIQRQIEYARQHGNIHRVAGLQQALEESKRHCSTNYLQDKHQHKVAKKQLKVQERENELKQAQQLGDQKKIAKKQKKLRQAQTKLLEAQQDVYY